jgi:hypothetical protein
MDTGAKAGVAGAILAAAALALGVWQYVQAQTPSYGSQTDIDNTQNAGDLIDFLKSNESKKVHLDFYCLGTGGGGCDTASTTQESIFEGNPVIAVSANGQTYWIHAASGSGNAEVDNGRFGAGAIVVKGDFNVSVRGPSGTSPPGIQNIVLLGA